METPLYFLTRAEAEAKLGKRVRLRAPIPGLRVGMRGLVVAVHQRDASQTDSGGDPQTTYAVVVSWEPYGTWFGKSLYTHMLEEIEDGRA